MNKRILSTIELGDMIAYYFISKDENVSFCLIPKQKKLECFWEKGEVDSLVQISIEGDASTTGFANGQTKRNGTTTKQLRYSSQDVKQEKKFVEIQTKLTGPNGLEVVHNMQYLRGYPAIKMFTSVDNTGNEDITLEMLSSFSLYGLTPFTEDEATGRMKLHRIRSRWSNEGRVETQTIEDLQLEPSWSRWGVRSEKFGVNGSMPVRGYFPFVAVEDVVSHVVWAISLGCASSWQIEAFRKDENLCVSGGLADFETGHWKKILKPGKTFRTPEAYLTVSESDFDYACQRLVNYQRSLLSDSQKYNELPVVFNEFCTTWGNPSQELVNQMVNVLQGKGIEYFVIDAGWYADNEKGWENNMGDWNISEELFPNGMESIVNRIKEAGMKPGIWFEIEVVGKDAHIREEKAHLLTKNGKLIVSGTRSFLDMRDEWTQNYLQEKVISFLNKYAFQYLKIDYNESIGIGCDGADSLGEGLREVVEATKVFFKKIREEVPGITIEICSSGGHRLEPSMIALSDFMSFSDAHEEKEIPVIASNLQRVLLPQKSQIWAVLRKDDSEKRLVYSIVSAMHGALCFSGDIFDLSKKQWEIVDTGIVFYKKVSPIIIDGITKYYGIKQKSYRKLKDWQATVRYAADGRQALVLIHIFDMEDLQAKEISIPLDSVYEIAEVFENVNHSVKVVDQHLMLSITDSFDAIAIWLKRNEKTI